MKKLTAINMSILSLTLLATEALANSSVCALKAPLDGQMAYLYITTQNDFLEAFNPLGLKLSEFILRPQSNHANAFYLIQNDEVMGELITDEKLPHTPGQTAEGSFLLHGRKVLIHCYSYPNTGGRP